MRNYQDLLIWQRSHALTIKIYKRTAAFPADERFGLISQMRRSSSSIPTNIAEGCGRNSNAEMRKFLIIAAGSSSELEYQLILSKDLFYLSYEIYVELVSETAEIRKMLYAFISNMQL